MRKKKILGIPANKKQFKDFEKCINHPFFVKRQLTQQWTDGKYDFKIQNSESRKNHKNNRRCGNFPRSADFAPCIVN